MKIGIVVDDTLDKTDGVQQYVLEIGRWLTEGGHEVHYLVGETKRDDIPNIHSLSRNINVRFNGNGLTTPLPASKRAIKELLHSHQFDILHVQMPYSPFMAGKIIMAAPPSTTIVGTFHILPYSTIAAAATRLLGMVQRRSLKRFTTIMATSTASSNFVRRSFKRHAHVVSNPIDLSRFHVKPQEPGKYCNIVFMGRLVPRKGAASLLQAVAALPVNVQEKIRVYIGGKGPELERLQSYVDGYGLSNIVTFAGFIPEADKVKFLSVADLAVFPSVSGESFGISLLEGMAVARGVTIGGDNPGYQTVLGAWPDLMVDPTDTLEFAEKLTDFIEHPDKRAMFHSQQRSAVLQYDIDVIGSKVLEQYEVALQRVSQRQSVN